MANDQRTALVLGWTRPAESLSIGAISAAFLQSASLSRSRHYVCRKDREAKARAIALIVGCLAFLLVAVVLAVTSV